MTASTPSRERGETIEPAENRLYPENYGAWAGMPKGRPPDFTRCCETVAERGRWTRWYQCTRSRGHGPDGAYCRQHDPEVAKARDLAARRRSVEKYNSERAPLYGVAFLAVLRQIAEGHNDARGLAAETVAEFDKGAMKTDVPDAASTPSPPPVRPA